MDFVEYLLSILGSLFIAWASLCIKNRHERQGIRKALLTELKSNKFILEDLLDKAVKREEEEIKNYSKALSNTAYLEALRKGELFGLPEEISNKLVNVYLRFKTINISVLSAIIAKGETKGNKKGSWYIERIIGNREEIERTIKLIDEVYKKLSSYWKIDC